MNGEILNEGLDIPDNPSVIKIFPLRAEAATDYDFLSTLKALFGGEVSAYSKLDYAGIQINREGQEPLSTQAKSELEDLYKNRPGIQILFT